MSQQIKVLIVDDYSIVRQGLANILRNETDIEVVGEAADLDQCLQKCRAAMPDIILLDTSLADTNVVTAIRLIRAQFDGVRIIAVADQSERNCAALREDGGCRVEGSKTGLREHVDCVVRSIRAGARGAIRLSDSTAQLVSAIRAVYAGEYWVDGNATARMMHSLFDGAPEDKVPLKGLTTREDLICRLIADGLSNKEIAARLSIAHQTVKNHVSAILRKSGLDDRLQIARAVLLQPACFTEASKLANTNNTTGTN